MNLHRKRMGIQSSAFHNAPHAHFAWMREHMPVYLAKVHPLKKAYIITHYDDVKMLLSDKTTLVKNPSTIDGKGKRAMWVPKAMQPLLNNMLLSDDPQHRRLRKLVQQAFTPKIINGMEGQIETITQTLCDAMDTDGTIDMIEALALPLPVRVIAGLVGVPDKDLDEFQLLAHKFLQPPSPMMLLTAIPNIRAFVRFIEKLAEEKRREPGEDVMTGLVQAEAEGDRLSGEELVAMVMLLLTAGHETTVNLIGNGLLALLQNRDEMIRLRNAPELMEDAVEEMLRYDSPLLMSELYYAADEMTLHGITIPKAAPVFLAIASANRDERAFENPDQLIIDRTPNKHLAFGKGMHFCLGAVLARLEAKVAIRVLLEHIKDIALAVSPKKLRRHPMWIVNKLKSLPVNITA